MWLVRLLRACPFVRQDGVVHIHRLVRPAAATTVLLAVGALSACSGGSGGGSPSPSSSYTRAVTTIGKAVTTASGSQVTAVRYEDPAKTSATAPAGQRYVAAEIKACGGPNGATVSPQLFRVVFADRRVVDADVDHIIRTPELHATTLAAGGCVTGWVSFPIDDGTKPTFVALTGSSLVGWRIR